MATAPILAPDGSIRMIPQNQVEQALSAGGKQVTKMQAPDKTLRWVPNDQVDAATSAGGLAIPGMPKPKMEMQPSYTQMAVENTPSGADPHNPGNMPRQVLEQAAPEDREGIQSGLATTAALTTGGTALAAGGKAVAGALIPPVVKLGQWASANPVKAYILYNLFKEVIPGAKKATKMIKEVPAGE